MSMIKGGRLLKRAIEDAVLAFLCYASWLALHGAPPALQATLGNALLCTAVWMVAQASGTLTGFLGVNFGVFSARLKGDAGTPVVWETRPAERLTDAEMERLKAALDEAIAPGRSATWKSAADPTRAFQRPECTCPEHRPGTLRNVP